MLELDQTYIDRIESWIDQLNSGLPQLNSFVLPGGTLLNAELHLCRTKCRAVERKIVAYAREAEVNELIIAYINRLSDLLFVMARSESKRAGVEEYLWKPGGTRND